jgi:cytochrome c oxidase cbb3-type subunit 1
VLHLGNNAAIPVSIFSPKSYIVWSGVQDAMVQWWYGHNAVGFFLTAGFLAMMYYFIPKRANRPIYSYRLSIIHFWALIFLYIWAGPHHLHYTALPDWAQTLGMTLLDHALDAVMGRNDQRPDDAVRARGTSCAPIPFFACWSCRWRSTACRPSRVLLMSIKAVNSLSHYTDWTIGHVHSGALGWVGYVIIRRDLLASCRWLWNKRERLYSLKLVNWHFWISTIGIVLLYISAMWVSGILQGLMWRAYTSLGFLEYSFIETVEAMHPFYVIRAIGGILFLAGALIMVFNLWMTVASGEAAPQSRETDSPHWSRRSKSHMSLWSKHAIFEKNSIVLLIGVLIVISIGGLVEIVPLFYLKSTIEKVSGMRPYTPLELAGRNIYVREGCYNCHSQMIRPLRDEVERYGHYSPRSRKHV